jgi:hypothetical protein
VTKQDQQKRRLREPMPRRLKVPRRTIPPQTSPLHAAIAEAAPPPWWKKYLGDDDGRDGFGHGRQTDQRRHIQKGTSPRHRQPAGRETADALN